MATDIALANRLLASFTGQAITATEMALVARARTGDDHAFEVLVRQYRNRVLNVAWRIVSDADAAQDVAQETFIKAYQQLPRFRGKSKFGTWLYRIAVNEARGHLRAQRRWQARWEKQATLQAVQPMSPEVGERAGPIVGLLQELPEKQRIVLALFYLQELSVAEIARAVRAPTGTVKAWLSRGRQRLRELAQERELM